MDGSRSPENGAAVVQRKIAQDHIFITGLMMEHELTGNTVQLSNLIPVPEILGKMTLGQDSAKIHALSQAESQCS